MEKGWTGLGIDNVSGLWYNVASGGSLGFNRETGESAFAGGGLLPSTSETATSPNEREASTSKRVFLWGVRCIERGKHW